MSIAGFNIISIFDMRLSAIGGINRQSITTLHLSNAKLKNARYAPKLNRVSFFNLTIRSLTPLAESDNCMTCERGMSFTTLFNSSGVTVKHRIKVSGQYKNSKNREWMKTLSTRSLDGNSYEGLAERVNEVCIAEQLNTFILSGLQTYFRICSVIKCVIVK